MIKAMRVTGVNIIITKKVKNNQNSKNDNNNYKNENQCNDDRKTIMITMIRIINERKLRMIIRVNIIITITMKTMRVARLIMRMAGKNDNESDSKK